jgi:hypothetical protein
MNEELRQFIHSAAVAGWWTVLLGAIWLTISWLIWRKILKAKPKWLQDLWGVDMDWNQIQSIMITFMAVAKLILLVCVLASTWLTLWAR